MILDIILVLLVTYGFYTGFNRGLIDTLFDAVSIIVGILVALKLSYIIINFLEKILPNLSPQLVYLIGLVLTFFIVMLIIRFIGKKIEGIFKFANVNIINKIGGGLLLSFILATAFSFTVLLISQIGLLEESTIQQSRTYKMVEPFPEYAKSGFEKVKPYFQEFWDKTLEIIEKAKELEKERKG